MKHWRARLRDARGSEIAEMAMVMPVMFLVFLGIFWAGRSYNIYATINHAAREGARAAVLSPCVTCSASAATVDSAVFAALQADHLDPTKIAAPIPVPSPTSCPGLTAACAATAGNVTVCQNALLTPTTASPQECGVLVEFTYPIDLPHIPLILPLENVQIAARGQERVEQ